MRWTITSGWAETDAVHHSPHQGIDFGMPLDTPIRAFESGQVVKVLHDGTQSFGNSVWVKFSDGYTAVYGHLDKVFVREGERVYTGEQIAFSGDTGHSTGPHLHLGILDPHGHWIDPSHYVDIAQVESPKMLYGSGQWSDHVVAHWFDEIGDSLGHGAATLVGNAMHGLLEHMPYIVGVLLVVGGFLKMFGSKKWAARLFIASGVGAGWEIVS